MDLAGAGQKAHKQRPDRAAASLVHVKIEEKFILAPFGIDWGCMGTSSYAISIISSFLV